jgi:hypothetical protein
MKTGNKILFTFLGTIALCILAFLLIARIYYARYKINTHQPFITKKYKIQDIDYIKLTDLSNVAIYYSDKSRIDQSYPINRPVRELLYTISGDTLIIKGARDRNSKSQLISIHCRKPFVEIQAIKSKIRLYSMKTRSISLQLDQSELEDWISDIDSIGFSVIHLHAVNKSRLAFNNFKIDTLDITLDSSRLKTNTRIKKITGNIARTSEINCNSFDGEIAVKKDVSSGIKFYNK